MARPTIAISDVSSSVRATRLATYGLLAAILAIAVNGLVRAAALRVGGVPVVLPLEWEPVIISSVVGAIGATLVYGVIASISTRPNRTFMIVAAIVLLLSFAGPVNAYLSPPPGMGLANAPWTVFATLSVMHVTGALAIVAVLTRATDSPVEQG